MDLEWEAVRPWEMQMQQVGALAIGHYGPLLQSVTAIEEMAELCQAISKGIRGKEDRANLIEEIADVEFMLEQLKQIHHCHREVVAWIRYKAARTKNRITDEVMENARAELDHEPGAKP